MQDFPHIAAATAEKIAEAAELLAQGKLVAFPTETVYGLGADAANDKATASIFAAKGRPSFNPLIIHLPDAKRAQDFVIWNDRAEKIASRFWPGPITLVLPRRPDCTISLLASAGLDTLAIRIPSHPVAHALLEKVGLPIAAPSANASGKLSSTTPAHVAESLGNAVNLILASGKSVIGLESTVLDLSIDQPTILRPGFVTREDLEPLLGRVDEGMALSPPNPTGLKSPGMLTSHYAPTKPVRLNAKGARDNEAFLCFGPDALTKGGMARLNLSPSGDLIEAAANLFSMLRQLDQTNCAGIAVMPIPDTGLGRAINDRLARAAAPRPA